VFVLLIFRTGFAMAVAKYTWLEDIHEVPGTAMQVLVGQILVGLHIPGVKMACGSSVMGHMDGLDSQFAADGTKCEAARSFNPSIKPIIAANGDTG
jgi:hypothetical protein